MKLVNAVFANQVLATSSGEIKCDECGVAEVKDQAVADALMGMGWRLYACKPDVKKEDEPSEEKPKKYSKK